MQTTVSSVQRFAHPAKNVGALEVSPGMIVADFGAGSGHYTLEFARALSGGGRVYAVDVQQDLLRRIKNEAVHRGLQNVEILHGDIERPHGSKLAGASIDLVLLSNVLFQLEHPAAALKEAHRAVRPAGTVAIIEWLDSFGGLGPTKKHVLSQERALALAEESHFSLAREFEAGAHHYGLIFKPTAVPSV